MADNNNSIDYNKLAEDCGLTDGTDSKTCLEKIAALKEQYSADDLAVIYNYFFEIAPTKELIMGVLSLIDKLRSKESIPVLADALVIKDKFKSRIDNDEAITQIRVNINKL